eukprot:TRINITY_DN3932_c0_g1_i5.p1 TRINITY_DN3932_c0_g1~~TRINITY_DN3932_c0_g1_i5.p1  ORF type:complete len:1888 (-),score=282.48 TRINITY_DN3932_c0_g1_i5:39-5237(-)
MTLGQVRLNEEDWSVEIEILLGPIIQGTYTRSGIISAAQSDALYLLRPFNFTLAGSSWDSYQLGGVYDITPDPVWQRVNCPFPSAGKFICLECSASTCAYPSGRTECGLMPVLSCVNMSSVSVCTQNMNIISREPIVLNYHDQQACPYKFGCCPMGPHTFVPPEEYITPDCPFSQDCFDMISQALCQSCSVQPWVLLDGKYLINPSLVEQIEYTCSPVLDPMSGNCDASIFSWPNFPLVSDTTCAAYTEITSSGGYLDDGSIGYYGNDVSCEWYVEVPLATEIRITILKMDIELDYDFIKIYDYDSGRLEFSLSGTLADLPTTEYSVFASKLYITFTTDKSVIADGFNLFFEGVSFTFPTTSLLLHSSSQTDVLTRTSPGEVSLLPFDGTDTQFWVVVDDGYGGTLISNYNDNTYLALNHNGASLLDSSGVDSSWFISPYIPSANFNLLYLNSSEYLTALNGTLLSSPLLTEETQFQIQDGTYNGCDGTTYVTVTPDHPNGTISDGSGNLFYAIGYYYCEFRFIVPMGGSIEIRLKSVDIYDTDSFYIWHYDTATFEEWYDWDTIPEEWKTGVNQTSEFSIELDVYSSTYGAGGFEFEYILHCGALCEALNETTSTTTFKTKTCAVPSSVNSCPTNHTLTNTTGIISRGPYYNEDTCSWLVHVPEADHLIIFFCSYWTEWYYDFLSIYDGPTVNASSSYMLSGDKQSTYTSIPEEITTSSNTVFIMFTSDYSVTKTGFKLSYAALYKPGPNTCSCNHYCVEWQGDFTCFCENGFRLIDGVCIDVNECLQGFCSSSLCNNTEGSYYCYCEPGYELADDLTCQDINECTTNTHDCSELCENTIGGYLCRCKSGSYLDTDGKTCINQIPSLSFQSTSVISYDNFCNVSYPLLEKNRHILRQGCAAKNGTKYYTCIFPFYFRNVKYEKCTTAGISRTDPLIPWCAISVDENLHVLDRGNCECSKTRANLVFEQPTFFVYGSSEPDLAVDGDTSDNINTAMFMNYDNWYSAFSNNILPDRIVFWGCPSCYKSVTHFTLHVSLTPDLSDFNWETTVALNSSFRTHEVIVPHTTEGLPQFLYVWSDYNVYLAEIQAFGDYVPKVLNQIDCSLLLSRNSFLIPSDVNVTTNDTAPQEQVYLLHKNTVSLMANFVNKFSFEITVNATDDFSFFIMAPGNSTNHTLADWTNKFIEISLQPQHSRVSIKGHNLDSSAITDIISNSSEFTFSDEKEHTCIITYVIDNVASPRDSSSLLYSSGKLEVYLNDKLPLISASVILHKALSTHEAFTGFYVHSSDSKKRSVESTGGLSLTWWKLGTEKFSDSTNVINGPADNSTSTIIGVVLGVVIFLIILVLLFLFLRKKNNSIERLPSEMLRHYRQFSRNARPWNIKGEVDSAHAYMKKLRVGTSGYARVNALWTKMGGQGIEIAEAYAVHNPEQLHSFATKHSSMTHNVRTNPSLFISDNWKDNKDKAGTRKWTKETYDKLVSQFEWNQSLLVPIVPALHGTNEDVAENIIKSGFVALARLDSGYYGKGIYFTTSAEYGLPYYATKVSPTVIISMVISGNAFPVIEHPKSKHNRLGAAMPPGYHSHYVLTRKDGLPCHKIFSGEGDEQYFDEIVIEQENSILPYYFLKISTNNLSGLAIKLQKEQERLRIEENERMEEKKRRKGLREGGNNTNPQTGRIENKEDTSSSEEPQATRIKKQSSSSSSEDKPKLERIKKSSTSSSDDYQEMQKLRTVEL